MKALALVFLFVGCATKYYDYPFITKDKFALEEDAPSSKAATAERPPKLLSGRKETESFCADQILFNKNAHDIALKSLPALVRQSCPGSKHLLNAKITQNWWTVLVYSRSCVEVESYCPKN